jgi:hypothetical protein
VAVSVSPVHGGGGPTVVGLRVVRLGRADDLDAVVPLAVLVERLRSAAEAGDAAVTVPPERGLGVAWAGTSAPRTGWRWAGALDADTLRRRAASGIAEIVQGTPDGAGAAAVAALRARVWGRPLEAEHAGLSGLVAGVAFVAEALGFLVDGETVAVYRSGPWWRTTTTRGHVLARRPALG